jgi:protein involved in polysaccharide export with SLBB domain
VLRSSPWSHPAIAAAAAVALAGLSACSDGYGAPDSRAIQSLPPADSRVYRLGVGDKLKVTVFGEQDLSGQFEINAQGNVPMPLIGDIPARGVPATDLREMIARRLAEGYIKNPKVSVEVVSYRPIYVHGEVRNGGEFAFKNGIKIRDAVAIAGGYTYRAEQKYVLIQREGQAQDTRIPMPSEVQLMPGDNIRIPERFF